MRKIIVVLLILSSVYFHPVHTQADVTMPCSAILEPVQADMPNAKGAALVYKVKLMPSFPRTSISMLANHLPTPSD